MRDFVIADNQELTCFAIESLLQNNEGNVVRAFNRAGLVSLLTQHPDAVVVLDYSLFDFQDEDQLLIIAERFSQSAWILLSDDELTPQFLRRVLYASHQFSVVFKDGALSDIREALHAASRGNRYLSQRALEAIISQQQEEEKPDLLTQTETEIVKAIAQGKTTKEIAAERFSSIHTITTHRKNIFRKLGINTAHEATKYALRAGLIDASEFYI
jgi:DNA-binding NarL/FixJ family response regulator